MRRRLLAGSPTRDSEDLRWLATAGYLSARVYGIDGLTEAGLITMRRAMDAGRGVFGERIQRWAQLEELTRRVRGDAIGSTAPVRVDEIARMLDTLDQVKPPVRGSGVRPVTFPALLQQWRRQDPIIGAPTDHPAVPAGTENLAVPVSVSSNGVRHLWAGMEPDAGLAEKVDNWLAAKLAE